MKIKEEKFVMTEEYKAAREAEKRFIDESIAKALAEGRIDEEDVAKFFELTCLPSLRQKGFRGIFNKHRWWVRFACEIGLIKRI